MQVKDVLPYYLGSDFRVRYVDSPEGSWTVWVKLTALRLAKLDDESIEQIQLALRPLDSMTEEEALEFIKAQRPFYHHADLEYYAHDVMGVTYRDGTMTMGVFGEPEGEYKISFYGCSPEGYHWLLSNGFDIFHLIQRGLAINSNTLTQ